MLDQVIQKYGGIEVSAMECYTDIFKLGDSEIQTKGEPNGNYKGNPIGYMRSDEKEKGQYRIMFEDTFEENLKELQEADFAIMNGLTYFGRKNKMEQAGKMYAMIFDLDEVTEKTLGNYLYNAYSEYPQYPIPNYIIMSGHGVHLYYVFEYGIPLYPNIKLQLKELKYALTDKMWNQYTTVIWDKKQYQGINQGFRVIGGKTKIEGVRVRAFRLNTHPYTLNQLNQFVPESKRIDERKLFKESKLTYKQAMEKYPEWYEKRVVQGIKKGTWQCKPDLYNWWIRQIKEGASVGHRYYCVMALAIYAVKSGISKEQLKKDAYELKHFLDKMSDENRFTEKDIKSALECYDERYITFPRDDIAKISGIQIEKNKRNGRRRHEHVKLMNYVRDELNGNKEWRNKDGRPTKRQQIKIYREEHPDAKKADCIRDLEISKMTVYKWWDAI